MLKHEIARYRQADILRESARARLAHEAILAAERDGTRRRFRLRRKERPAFKPALT
jgi:hypothetical protein